MCEKSFGDIADDLGWPEVVKTRQTGSGIAWFDLSLSLEVNGDGTSRKGMGETASFAAKVLSDCPYLAPFPRYRRRKSDYVMPKKSSYENVQIAKKLFYMGKVNPYHVSEHELCKYVNEFRGPR